MKRLRMWASIVLIIGAVAAVLFIPLPSRVWAPFEIQPHAAESVYVEVPGRLVDVRVKPGQRVEQGELIAVLENLDLQLAVEQLRGERDKYRVQLENLEDQRFGDKRDEADQKIAVYREQLEGVEEQLAQQRRDIQRLIITAPIAGTIIPPTRVEPQKHTGTETELAGWTGTPLDPENRGAAMSPDGPQNLLCKIGDPNDWEALLVVNQDDVDLVLEGQEVQLMLEESSYHVFTSTIEQRSTDVLTNASVRLASTSGGPLATQPERDGTMRPLETSYQATARLDNSRGLLRNGLTGRAKITTRDRTLWERLTRYFSRTFNFEL